jgi:hypothetical protein
MIFSGSPAGMVIIEDLPFIVHSFKFGRPSPFGASKE